jgi:hypothetical protein
MRQHFIFSMVLILASLSTGYSQYSKAKKEKFAFHAGVKVAGGAITSRPELSYIGNENDYVLHEITLSSSKPQWAFGAFANKRFGWLYAEATTMYSTYGMTFDVRSYVDGNGEIQQRNERFSYVDLQMMGGITDNGFRIAVGPVMHILANQDSEMTTLTNYNQQLRKVSYGFSGLIGYNYGPVTFELKYDRAFRSIGDHVFSGHRRVQFKEAPNALMLQAAYNIK